MITIPTVTNEKATIPLYATPGASGADLFAAIDLPITIAPLSREIIPTGLFVQIPEGFEIQIRSRSGLAFKHGIMVLNSPGTIDSDYRGEIKIVLLNTSNESFTIEPNMRIAQAILSRFEKMNFIVEEKLEESTRGSGGFGHTGL